MSSASRCKSVANPPDRMAETGRGTFAGMRRRFVPLPAILAFALARSAHALEPAPTDWSPLAAVEEIQVLSQDADGSAHETTVWLAVVDGQGFIRTGNTSWYPNLERKPEIGV